MDAIGPYGTGAPGLVAPAPVAVSAPAPVPAPVPQSPSASKEAGGATASALPPSLLLQIGPQPPPVAPASQPSGAAPAAVGPSPRGDGQAAGVLQKRRQNTAVPRSCGDSASWDPVAANDHARNIHLASHLGRRHATIFCGVTTQRTTDKNSSVPWQRPALTCHRTAFISHRTRSRRCCGRDGAAAGTHRACTGSRGRRCTRGGV